MSPPVSITIGTESGATGVVLSAGSTKSFISFASIINDASSLIPSLEAFSSAAGLGLGALAGQIEKVLDANSDQSIARDLAADLNPGGSSNHGGGGGGGYYFGYYGGYTPTIPTPTGYDPPGGGGGGGDYGGGGGGEFGDGGGYYAETDARGRKLGSANRAEIGAPKHETIDHSPEIALSHALAAGGATVAGHPQAGAALDLALTGHHLGHAVPAALAVMSDADSMVRLASLHLAEAVARHTAAAEAGAISGAHETSETEWHLATHR